MTDHEERRETVSNDAPTTTTALPSRPTMPLPFDRSKLKDEIRQKRSCSPVDFSTMPEECDRLLNLPPISHRKEHEEGGEAEEKKEEIPDENEEIDCGDLFGSKRFFLIDEENLSSSL